MTSELTMENLAELEAATERLRETPKVPAKDSMLKLVEKQKEIAAANVPLEVDDSKVAERIKQASENSGITFTDLARGCGVTDKVVWQWAATGKISKAKLPTLARLCDVSVTWLLTGQEHESLFQPTQDKLTSMRHAEFGDEQTTYFPSLSQGVVNDRSIDLLNDEIIKALAETNPMHAWVHKPGVPGIPKFGFKILTSLFWDSPDHTHPIQGDYLIFANDLMPLRGDIVLINVNPKQRAWGYLKSVGGFTRWGSSAEEFNQVKTWRLSRNKNDVSSLGDIVLNDLKLTDVVGVCISLSRATTPRIHEMHTENTESFTLDDRRL